MQLIIFYLRSQLYNRRACCTLRRNTAKVQCFYYPKKLNYCSIVFKFQTETSDSKYKYFL